MAPDLESAFTGSAAGASSFRSSCFFGQGTPSQGCPGNRRRIAQSLPGVAIELSPAAGDDEGVIAALAAFCVAEARKD
jgi:hypothetical protein